MQKNQKVGQKEAEAHLQTRQSPTEAEPEQNQGRQVELPGKVLLPCQALKESNRLREKDTPFSKPLCVQQKYRGAFQGRGRSTEDDDFMVMPPLSGEKEQLMGYKKG